MTTRMDSRWPLCGILAALAVSLAPGCSVFQERLSPQLTAQVTPSGVEDGKLGAPPANFTVECRSSKGEPVAKEQPLVGHLTIQEALEHTKANKKFRKFTLELHRPLPDGRLHLMTVEYDRTQSRVAPEFDYAILPGDRLIVTEDTTTVFDEMLDRMSAPFGGSPKPTKRDLVKERFRMEG